MTIARTGCLAATLFATLGYSLASAAPIIIGSYYEENVKISKSGQTNPTFYSCQMLGCTLMFSDVPAGKRLTVTDISCSFENSDGQGTFVYATFGEAVNAVSIVRPQPLRHTVILRSSTNPNSDPYKAFIVEKVRRVFIATENPAVHVITGGSLSNSSQTWDGECQLIGTLSAG